MGKAARTAAQQRIVADLPFIWAQVVYACREEMALTVADVLMRRMQVF